MGAAADNFVPAGSAPPPPSPELFRKLLWLTGLRLLVGTALLQQIEPLLMAGRHGDISDIDRLRIEQSAD